MKKEEKKEYGLSNVFVYANGLISCSVCAPEDMSCEEVERITNLSNPSGVAPWRISPEKFRGGAENPHKCEKYPEEKRLHYLLNC